MTVLTTHLLRRGLAAATDHVKTTVAAADGSEDSTLDIGLFAACLIFGASSLFFAFYLFMVSFNL